VSAPMWVPARSTLGIVGPPNDLPCEMVPAGCPELQNPPLIPITNRQPGDKGLIFRPIQPLAPVSSNPSATHPAPPLPGGTVSGPENQ